MSIIDNYHKVGIITNSLGLRVNFLKEGTIYAAPGVLKHIKRRHSNELSEQVLNNLIGTIKSVIATPDFIGKHPGDDKVNTMEFVKKIDDNILVSIEVDIDNDYIYVSTVFPVKQSKIERRLHSGRLQRV